MGSAVQARTMLDLTRDWSMGSGKSRTPSKGVSAFPPWDREWRPDRLFRLSRLRGLATRHEARRLEGWEVSSYQKTTPRTAGPTAAQGPGGLPPVATGAGWVSERRERTLAAAGLLAFRDLPRGRRGLHGSYRRPSRHHLDGCWRRCSRMRSQYLETLQFPELVWRRAAGSEDLDI